MTTDAEHSAPLPSYERPPVIEVALGLAFQPLHGLDFDGLAALRARWSDDYPIVQQQVPLPPPNIGDSPLPMVVQVGPPPIRLWLLNEAQDRLVQVQADRIVINWRAIESDGVYPRYNSLRREFEARWEDFQQFLVDRNIHGGARPVSVEVTYINMIELDSPEKSGDLSAVLRTHNPVDGHLGAPIQSNVSYMFDLTAIDGYQSRMQVVAAPDLGRSTHPLVVQINAQAAAGSDKKSALAALDRAHEHIVRTFDEITTGAMHERWGRLK